MATILRRGEWIRGGFWAGAGAALVMMLVMAVLRFTSNTVSIPELMEESLIRLTGGQIHALDGQVRILMVGQHEMIPLHIHRS